MENRKKRLVIVSGVVGVFLAACYFLLTQAAFLNHGQEFGAYGLYHRVVRVAQSMDDYTLVRHRVHRKLDLGHIFQVEEFSLTLRDKSGRSGEIFFKKGADDMRQQNAAALREVIRIKYTAALSKIEAEKEAAVH